MKNMMINFISTVFGEAAKKTVGNAIEKYGHKKVWFVLLASIIVFIVILGTWNSYNRNEFIEETYSTDSIETTIPLEIVLFEEASATSETISVELKNAKIGDVVSWGQYLPLGAEEATKIEWIVLERKENECLLISKYGLEVLPYHWDIKSTWEDSDIRTWLFNDFYTNSFSDFEKEHILSSKVKAEKVWSCSPGDDTMDYVFLFSNGDIEEHVRKNMNLTSSAKDDIMHCEPTDFLKTGRELTLHDGYCWWWLRNTTRNNTAAYYVSSGGAVQSKGFELNTSGGLIRPAIRISVE